MTSRWNYRSRKPIAGTCRTLKYTFSTPVISHWTPRQMRWQHWSYILSVLHVEDLTFQTRRHICQTRKQPSSREHRVVLVRVWSRPSSMRGYNVLATAPGCHSIVDLLTPD